MSIFFSLFFTPVELTLPKYPLFGLPLLYDLLFLSHFLLFIILYLTIIKFIFHNLYLYIIKVDKVHI